jgi:hypothetical protein
MSATAFARFEAPSVSSAFKENGKITHVIKIGNVIFFISISIHHGTC